MKIKFEMFKQQNNYNTFIQYLPKHTHAHTYIQPFLLINKHTGW